MVAAARVAAKSRGGVSVVVGRAGASGAAVLRLCSGALVANAPLLGIDTKHWTRICTRATIASGSTFPTRVYGADGFGGGRLGGGPRVGSRQGLPVVARAGTANTHLPLSSFPSTHPTVPTYPSAQRRYHRLVRRR